MKWETERRERVLKLLGLTLEAAGLTGIGFVLKESERRPDIVKIMKHGQYCAEACIDCDSLSAMVMDVLEKVL